MNARTRIAAAAAAAWALAGPPSVAGLALRSGAKHMVVHGLEPGRPCPLEKCAGGPLTVFNSGLEGAAVALSVVKPAPGELQDGYEPAQSADWVRLARDRMTLEPGKDGRSEATVTVPRGGGPGGWYQLDWLADAASEEGLKLRLRSRLLLRVDDDDSGDWDLERGKTPRRDAQIVLLGGKARSLEAGLKWANAGERAQRVRVSVRVPDDSEVPEGYEPCPNPAFLRAPRRVPVPAGKVATAELEPAVPDQPRYRGRKWAFAVTTQALEAPEGAVERTIVLMDTREAFSR